MKLKTPSRRVYSLVMICLLTFAVAFQSGRASEAVHVEGHRSYDRLTAGYGAFSAETFSASAMAPMKGMTLNAWSAEAYNSSDFDQSIANLASINANWVTLTVFWFMEKHNDTDIHGRLDLYTASDSSLVHAIQKAHELNMKVALKPMVDVIDGTWRGVINPASWTLWFQNYQNFINYYADFAKANNVELLEVGTELRSSQPYESEWRQVISQVRTRFSKNLTYAANWDSYSTYSRLPQYAVKFWDALDYVGVDAYFPLTNSFNPTVQQLENAWTYSTASGWWGTGFNWTNELYLTYTQTHKKMIFTEIGYYSQDGVNTQPWTGFTPPHQIDLQEQADCYQANLEVFKDKTWFMGWFWWDWQTDPNAGGPLDNWYTPQNKPAQNILKQYYLGNYLEVYTDPAGITIVPGEGFYVKNTNVTLTAQAYVDVSTNTRYRFDYWDVDGTSRGSGVNPITVFMNANHTATAHYILQYSVVLSQTGLFSDATGTVVTVDSIAKAFGDLPFTKWVDNGGLVTYSYNDAVLSTVTGKRFKQVSVAGPTSPITVNGSVSVIGDYKIQFEVTFDESGVGPDFTGTVVIIDSANYNGSSLPVFPPFWWDWGSSHSFAFASPLVVNATKLYVWACTSGLTSLQGGTLVINACGSVVGNYAPTSTLHDIAISNVTTLKKIVGQGFSTRINVTVTNQGNYDEAFNVTVYANTTTIGTLTRIILTNGSSQTITFTWNTTGFGEGEYTVSAEATLVSGEIDKSDNTIMDGTVLITLPGDVNGDKKVDGKDIALVAKCFGKSSGQPGYIPECDINCDGKIDGKDIATAAKNFGRRWT